MELKFILEALLFHSQKPQNASELKHLLASAATGSEDELVRAFKKTSTEEINAALQELEAEHVAAGRSFRLTCVAGAWQFVNQPEYAPWLRALLGEKSRPPRLSQPALETLTIIAYRQPLTRTEMEQIRGVSVDGVMQTLLERGLIEAVGRAEVVGRPVIYGTTPAFLEYFGLRRLEDLPAAEELRRIPVTRPEALTTVDPGLATVTPDLFESTAATPADAADGGAPATSDAPKEKSKRRGSAGARKPAEGHSPSAAQVDPPAKEESEGGERRDRGGELRCRRFGTTRSGGSFRR